MRGFDYRFYVADGERKKLLFAIGALHPMEGQEWDCSLFGLCRASACPLLYRMMYYIIFLMSMT